MFENEILKQIELFNLEAELEKIKNNLKKVDIVATIEKLKMKNIEE